MSLETTFSAIAREDIHAIAEQRKKDGARYVQMLCTLVDDGVDVTYSFMQDNVLENLTIPAVKKGEAVQSISDLFFPAFVFENEAHDLFDVTFKDIAIDFGGNFYALSQKAPMTIISPEKKAAKEKAAKLAAAKAAKEAKAAKAAGAEKSAADEDAEFEAKLAAMDPEKAAKVRAAMEAKKKKAAAKAAQEGGN